MTDATHHTCLVCGVRECFCGSQIRMRAVDGMWNWIKHTHTQKHRRAVEEAYLRRTAEEYATGPGAQVGMLALRAQELIT